MGRILSKPYQEMFNRLWDRVFTGWQLSSCNDLNSLGKQFPQFCASEGSWVPNSRKHIPPLVRQWRQHLLLTFVYHSGCSASLSLHYKSPFIFSLNVAHGTSITVSGELRYAFVSFMIQEFKAFLFPYVFGSRSPPSKFLLLGG